MRPGPLGLALALALLGPAVPRSSASAGGDPRLDAVVAKVGPTSITVGDLERRMRAVPRFQLATFGSTADEVKRNFLQKIVIPEALFAAGAKDRHVEDSPQIRDRIIETLRMARQVGGTELTPVLRALAASVRADTALRAEVESRQSWIRGAAVLGVAAPWIILSLLAMRPEGAEAYGSPEGVDRLNLSDRFAWKCGHFAGKSKGRCGVARSLVSARGDEDFLRIGKGQREGLVDIGRKLSL